MTVQRKRLAAMPMVLMHEMETLRSQLNQMIGGDCQKLLEKEVYQLSSRLDQLIVQYMKAVV